MVRCEPRCTALRYTPTNYRMTLFHNYVVASLAALLGLVLIAGALLDGPWLMQLPKAQRLTELLGRRASRIVLALLGIALIALAGVIASGWRMQW